MTDDATLQSEPLMLRVFCGSESIGTIYLGLNTLINNHKQHYTGLDDDVALSSSAPSSLSGWFPIYDTLQGVRGELNVVLKLNFVTDDNPFKESSAGMWPNERKCN